MSYLITLIAISAIVWVGWKLTSRNAYESADYTVMRAEGALELREYPDLMLASTNMVATSADDAPVGDGSFGRLFNYISGGNDSEQKVAMTTPVFMKTGEEDGQNQMGFVIPKNVAADKVPQPSNSQVEISRRAGGKFAVIRFAGRLNSATIAQKREALLQWISDQGLEVAGEQELAGYDPPWTPGIFRRN